jgi:presqualene diphosphate phosphatase
LLLYRHHILDVVGGVFVGFLEALVMAVIWIGPETAINLVKWISDDRVSGNDAEII